MSEFETIWKERYMNLRAIDQVPAREEIRSKCDISYAVFYNYLRGTSPVPKLVEEAMDEIFNNYENIKKSALEHNSELS